MMLTRSLCRSLFRRSQVFYSSYAAPGGIAAAVSHQTRHLQFSSSPLVDSSPNRNHMHASAMRLGAARSFSDDVSHMPVIKDQEIENAFKDLMGSDWSELTPAVVADAKNAVSKSTDDKAAQDALKNVFRAAEAAEEFSAIIMNLKLELDDEIGGSGENVKPLPEEYVKAIQTLFNRYVEYLAAFGSEENYLKKKVEMELGSKMIYLKMRCAGLAADWGKITVLATSGLSGSYVEQRA